MLGIPPAPDRLEPPGADQLSFRSGGTPVPPVGIVVLGMGLWILGFILIRGLPKLWAPPMQGHWTLAISVTALALLVVAFWIVVGLFLTFGHAGAIFRRSPRSVTIWWQVLWLLRTKTHSLDERQAVEVEMRRGHRGRPFFHFVVRGVDRPEIRINAIMEPLRADAERMAAEVNALLGKE
jgi:hypothetical protein